MTISSGDFCNSLAAAPAYEDAGSESKGVQDLGLVGSKVDVVGIFQESGCDVSALLEISALDGSTNNVVSEDLSKNSNIKVKKY